MWKTWVWSLGWEDPLEEGTATHSSILAWRIPWGSKKCTPLSDFHFHPPEQRKPSIWRRETNCCFPGFLKSVLLLLFLFSVFVATPGSMWDLSALTKDQTCAPELEALSPNLWTARYVPVVFLFEFRGISVGWLMTLSCLVFSLIWGSPSTQDMWTWNSKGIYSYRLPLLRHFIPAGRWTDISTVAQDSTSVFTQGSTNSSKSSFNFFETRIIKRREACLRTYFSKTPCQVR